LKQKIENTKILAEGENNRDIFNETVKRATSKGLTLWSLTIRGNHFSRARCLFSPLISGNWIRAKNFVSHGR